MFCCYTAFNRTKYLISSAAATPESYETTTAVLVEENMCPNTGRKNLGKI